MSSRTCYRYVQEGDHRDAAKALLRSHANGEHWADYNVHLSGDGLTVLLVEEPSDALRLALRGSGWAAQGREGRAPAEVPDVVGG